MSGGSSCSFRVQDALIVQRLDAMADRSDFIRQAVAEKLSVVADNAETVRRLRAGLASIANSTELILDAGGDEVPELVHVGVIGIREAAMILAAEPQGGERAEPEPQETAAMAAGVARAVVSPPDQPELLLCASGPDSHADPEPDPNITEPRPPIQEDHP